MAKVTINREVEVCDRCRREGYLQECLACGAMFCLTCNTTILGCWVRPKVCRNCGTHPKVKEICDRHAALITPILEKRADELSALELPKTVSEW